MVYSITSSYPPFYDEDNNTLEDVSVQYYGGSVRVRTVSSDDDGEVIILFSGLGEYTFRVSHEDYRTLRFNVDVLDCDGSNGPADNCVSNSGCAFNEYCSGGNCVRVPCGCGEVVNHICDEYECCSDYDCSLGEECRGNLCQEVVDSCGDEVCDYYEDCDNCIEDCGECEGEDL